MKNVLDIGTNLAALSSNNESTRHTTVVCVTNQMQCERIIKAGAMIAALSKTKLMVISVMDPANLYQGQALDYLFDVSKKNKAVMTVFYSENPAKTITGFIKRSHAVNVLTGMPSSKDSVLYKLWEKFTHIAFFTVAQDGELDRVEQCETSGIA